MATHAEKEQRRKDIVAELSRHPVDDRLAVAQKLSEKYNLSFTYVRKMARDAGVFAKRVKGQVIECGTHAESRKRNADIVKAIAKAPRSKRGELVEQLAAEHGISPKYIRVLCSENGITFAGTKSRQARWMFEVIGTWLATGGDVAATAEKCRTSTERVGELVKMAREAGVVE